MQCTVVTSADRHVKLPDISLVKIKISGNLINWTFPTEDEAHEYTQKFRDAGFRYVHLDTPGNVCVESA